MKFAFGINGKQETVRASFARKRVYPTAGGRAPFLRLIPIARAGNIEPQSAALVISTEFERPRR
jgi:hypothetical protein